jgi:hypothetical protein
MMVISLDRFLALYLHMRYHSRVTVRHTMFIMLVLWVSCGVSLPGWFHSNRNITSALVIPFTSLYFVTSLICYIKIHQIVRRHRRQIAIQLRSLNVPTPRQGRSITTSIYIHGLFIICLIPIVISNVVSLASDDRQTVSYFLYVAWTIVFINSSLNPLLYIYRMKDIKKVVVRMAKSFFCWRILQLKRVNVSPSWKCTIPIID